MKAHSKSLLLLARHFWVIKYWQPTPNKTRTVSHRVLVKTQKASDRLVWAGFIVSWCVTSPALMCHYTWIDFTCASRHITQSFPQSVNRRNGVLLKGNWLEQSMNMCIIIMLWLHMHTGWSSLKNKLFKCYLSIRNSIMGQLISHFCCWFNRCNLIVSSASNFWDFRIPPFIKIGLPRAARRSCKYGLWVKRLSLRLQTQKGVCFKMIYFHSFFFFF